MGGPSNVGCLNNRQQAGEGWSDYMGQWYSIEVGDQGTDPRGIGAYLFGQSGTGPGIRPQQYSTDPAVNTYTYESINGLSVPHGVGSVWAQAAWEATWALIDAHGFDPDIFDVSAGAGNHRAMLYINEGLKNTACSPAFVDGRDGILQAAADNFGGQDVCLLWRSFAAFGLGTDAVSGGSNSTTPTNGFSIPASCTPYALDAVTQDEVIRTQPVSGFTNPRVVMGPISFNGGDPGTIRVRNVTATSFQHNWRASTAVRRRPPASATSARPASRYASRRKKGMTAPTSTRPSTGWPSRREAPRWDPTPSWWAARATR